MRLLWTVMVFVIFLGGIYAMNLEINVSQPPKLLDNETAVLSVIVVNNEIGLALEKTRFHYTLKGNEEVLDLGNIAPEERVEKQIVLSKLSAGTYPVDYYVSYSFLGEETNTQISRLDVISLLSKEITMNLFPITFSKINISNQIQISKPFTVSFFTNVSIPKAEIEVIFDGEGESFAISSPGGLITKEFVPKKSGGLFLTITAYSINNGEKTLEDVRKIQLQVSNPQETQPIPFEYTRPETKSVIVEKSNGVLDNFVKDVGCFVTGCNSDIQPPIISNFSYSETGDQFTFSLIADDSTTGNSNVSSCSAVINGKTVPMSLTDTGVMQNAQISVVTSEITDTIQFTCSDSQGNSAQLTYAVKKKQPVLATIIVVSDDSTPIQNAGVYLDSELLGYTGSDGSTMISTSEGQHELTVKARGFEDSKKTIALIADSSNKFEVQLIAKIEAKFTPSPEFQTYTSMTSYYGFIASAGVVSMGDIQVHPADKQIKRDTMSILSGTTEIDAAKSMLGGDRSYKGVGKYLQEYDGSCLATPVPTTCQAWHGSDYEILQSTKGVCADWATLTTSFGNSMGLPTRPIYLYGGNGNSFAHAFTEVNIPSKGWTTLDTLWMTFDNPCVYPNSGGFNCINNAYAILPDGTHVDRTDYYACGVPRCASNTGNPSTLALLPPPRGETGLTQENYKIILKQNSADINLTIEYSTSQYSSIKNENHSSLPNFIYYQLNATVDQIKNISIIENETIGSIQYNFIITKDFSQNFNHQVITSQFDEVTYDLLTNQSVSLTNPAYDSKSTVNGTTEINWRFTSPGVHNINLILQQSQILLVYSSDLRNVELGRFVSKLQGVTSKSADETNSFRPTYNFSLAYILGDYIEVPTSSENKIDQYSASSIRLYGDPQDVSIELFKGLGKMGGKIILINELDALAIKDSESQNGDALIFYNPDRTDDLIQELTIQKPAQIIFVNSVPAPNKLLVQLKDIAPVEERNIRANTSISFGLINSSNTSSVSNSAASNNLELPILLGACLLFIVVIVIAKKVFEKSKR